MIGEQFLIKRAYNTNPQDIYNAFKLENDPQVALNKKLKPHMPVRLSENTQWDPGKRWDFNKPRQQRVNISYPFLGGTVTTTVNKPQSSYQSQVDELKKWRRDDMDRWSSTPRPTEQMSQPAKPRNPWEEANKKYEEAEMQYELQLAHQERMKKLRDHYLSRDDDDDDYDDPFDDGQSYNGEWKTEDVRNHGVRYNPNAANPFFQRDRLQNQAEALRKSQQEYDQQQAQKPAVKAPVIR